MRAIVVVLMVLLTACNSEYVDEMKQRNDCYRANRERSVDDVIKVCGKLS